MVYISFFVDIVRNASDTGRVDQDNLVMGHLPRNHVHSELILHDHKIGKIYFLENGVFFSFFPPYYYRKCSFSQFNVLFIYGLRYVFTLGCKEGAFPCLYGLLYVILCQSF